MASPVPSDTEASSADFDRWWFASEWKDTRKEHARDAFEHGIVTTTMDKLVRHCDICGKPDALRFCVEVDSQVDAAGDLDGLNESFDLCSKHMHSQLALLLYQIPIAQRRHVVARIVRDKLLYTGQL